VATLFRQSDCCYLNTQGSMMDTKLQPPAEDLQLQKDDEGSNDEMMKNMEQEIECPRCYDVMNCHLTLIV
jgi:hypothetical protein